MKALAILPAAIALAGPTFNAGMPPERYQGGGVAIVVFTNRAGIDAFCGVAPPPYRIIACKRTNGFGQPVIYMPDPCPLGETEWYARIACHELGHVRGWTGEHEA